MSKKQKPVRESSSRAELEARHGRVWDTRELAKEFIVLSIILDRVMVRRKWDASVGQMSYQNDPWYYFHFVPAAPEDTEG